MVRGVLNYEKYSFQPISNGRILAPCCSSLDFRREALSINFFVRGSDFSCKESENPTEYRNSKLSLSGPEQEAPGAAVCGIESGAGIYHELVFPLKYANFWACDVE